MGMAASQARFLGLTARKSNVEYQGQQINQERTALATESSNLYNQMLALEVPTPPVTTDYYNTVYTLDDSDIGNCGEYTIESLTKTYNGTNYYSVTLKTTQTTTTSTSNTFLFTRIARDLATREVTDDDGNTTTEDYYIYTTTLNGTYLTYDEENDTAYTTDSSSGNNVLSVTTGTIYKIDSTTASLLSDNDGFNSVLEQLSDEGITVSYDFDTEDDDTENLYFYLDSSGKYCYITESQLERITSEAFEDDCSYGCEVNGDVATMDSGTYMTLYYPTEKTTDIYTEVSATVETNSSGRYSSITIDENENYPSILSGATFSITTTSEYDEDAYSDAYNDYEYLKAVYEQTISDINAQTEVIQSEDKQLELRLQQLDTEQEAIAKEMDSVEQVMNDNIEKTFDAFA